MAETICALLAIRGTILRSKDEKQGYHHVAQSSETKSFTAFNVVNLFVIS